MTDAMRVVLELGPKGRRVVAGALDWPGLDRWGKDEPAALGRLTSYIPRYAAVAKRAGLAHEFERQATPTVVERYAGNTSTDFWGISFSPSSLEHGQMDDGELERKLALLQACWAYFDAVGARVSPEMRKGPRGGGRDRDRIIRHVIRNESEEFAKSVGLRVPEYGAMTPDGLRDYRAAYLEAIRAYNRGEVPRKMRSWTLPFLIRHSAFHTMDHAWEMEDKDLTGVTAS